MSLRPETRITPVHFRDISKGFAIDLRLKTPLSDQEIQKFDQLAVSHIVSIIGTERFVRENNNNTKYMFGCITRGDLMVTAMEAVGYDKLDLWLRALYHILDDVQYVGVVELGYNPLDQTRKLTPRAMILDRREIPLEVSQAYARQVLVPTIGNIFEIQLG